MVGSLGKVVVTGIAGADGCSALSSNANRHVCKRVLLLEPCQWPVLQLSKRVPGSVLRLAVMVEVCKACLRTDMVMPCTSKARRREVLCIMFCCRYENTEKRIAKVASKGLQYLGMGVSGGEEGARRGEGWCCRRALSCTRSAVPL